MYNTKRSRTLYISDIQPKTVKMADTCPSAQVAGIRSTTTKEQSIKKRHALLRNSGQNGVKGSHQDEPHKRFELLLLHSEQGDWKRIEQAIAHQQWRYLSLTSVSALQNSFQDDVKVVLIDASFLPEISMKLRLHYSQRQTTPALFFVSDRCDIKIRIQAIQAGARKLFPEPVDIKDLIREIGNIIQPKIDCNFKVLVIAEDRENAKPTSDLLHQGAIETLVMTEPLAIIDTIWQFRPDLILMLDPRLSDVDNIVLTKLIREREESLAIPIVFFSDDNNPEKKLQALLAGADDFLLKPMQSQQVLTAVTSRIERNKAISAAGVQIVDERPVESPDRKAMLLQLGKVLTNLEDDNSFHGLIIISLGSSPADNTVGEEANRDQLTAALIDGFWPILQVKDYLAKTGNGHIAILIQRSSKNELKRLANLVIDITNYRLITNAKPKQRFGVSLKVIADGDQSVDELLQQGEQTADNAYRQWHRGYSHYIEAAKYPWSEVKEGTTWQREEFMYALQNGSTTFRERKFVCPKIHVSMAETIELIPQHDLNSIHSDIYQQATLCGATIELDRFNCEYGMQRLYEYTHQGKQVRLIVRQTVAVLDDHKYIEFIKTILRRFHIVGTGLLLEFSLPSIASRLNHAIALFNQLTALGIGVSLSHFLCNDVGYKALLNLKADVVRPRSSYLQGKAALTDIESVARNIHSQQAEMILPYIEQTEEISPKWYQYADYIQADLIQEKQVQEALARSIPTGSVWQRWRRSTNVDSERN